MATVIAEAGVNHNGRLDLALELVDAAAAAGADIVKFQTFRASALATAQTPKADYQKETTGGAQSQLAMLQGLELDRAAHVRILERCRERGIAFLSTPFDEESLRMLCEDLGLERLKIGSGDMSNAPLVLAAARTRRPIILSTGMATLPEVREALGVIGFGYRGGSEPPGLAAFQRAWEDAAVRAILREKVIVLHCTTAYPTPPGEINLRAMDVMAADLGLPIGFSDHSDGIAVPIAAVGRGAVTIEKHLTLDRTMEGPDHRASLEPGEFAMMVRGIREASAALGESCKQPRAIELANVAAARKSLVATSDIAAGERFGPGNLGTKRPGTGLPPVRYWEFLGRVADRAYRAGDLIQEAASDRG